MRFHHYFFFFLTSAMAPTALAQGHDIPSLNLVTHSGVVIDAPVQKIWPFIVEPSQWKAGTHLIPIRKKGAHKGRVFKAVMPDDPDTVLFYVTNVEFSPGLRRTLRLNSVDGALMGFASFELIDLGASTMVKYHVYSQSVLPPESAAELDIVALAELQAQYEMRNAERFDAELLTLKNLVENGQ